MRLLAILLALALTTTPALAENVYQTAAMTTGFNFTMTTGARTQIIPAPPIATQSIKILAIQSMVAESATGGNTLLQYGTGVNCATNTTTFALLNTSTAAVATTINSIALGYGTAPVYVIPAGVAACVTVQGGGTISAGTIAGTYIYQ